MSCFNRGDTVKFIDPLKYDSREHTVLHVQNTHNDVCYFLHYWSWIDEDELELVEDNMKEEIKVGDKFRWKSTPYDVTTITKVNDNNVSFICSSDNYSSESDIEGFFSAVTARILEDGTEIPIQQDDDEEEQTPTEDVVKEPAHYTNTKISALDVIDDAVNPAHYNGTEVLDQMILIYGVEAVKGFCICNAFKYRQRAGKKSSNIEEDIKKAIWYEEKHRELSKAAGKTAN